MNVLLFIQVWTCQNILKMRTDTQKNIDAGKANAEVDKVSVCTSYAGIVNFTCLVKSSVS